MNKYLIYIFIASLIWGTSFPAITIGLKYTNPIVLLFLRFIIATSISFALFPKTISHLKDIDMVIVGLFNGFSYLFQFIGQQYVPAGQSSILVNFYSVLVPIISLFILHEVPSKKIIFAVILGFLGVILLAEYNKSISASFHNYIFGIIIIFFSGVSWAFYVVFSKKSQTQRGKNDEYISKYSYQDLFTASMFYTSLIAFFSLFFVTNPFSNIRLESLIVSSYLGIFATVITFLLYLIGLEKISATNVSVILLSEVLVAYIISILYLGEIITIIQFMGSIFIIISLFLVIKNNQSVE